MTYIHLKTYKTYRGRKTKLLYEEILCKSCYDKLAHAIRSQLYGPNTDITATPVEGGDTDRCDNCRP